MWLKIMFMSLEITSEIKLSLFNATHVSISSAIVTKF